MVLETEDISYLVKIDVKVDGSLDEEEDKEYYDEDIKGAEEIADDEDSGRLILSGAYRTGVVPLLVCKRTLAGPLLIYRVK